MSDRYLLASPTTLIASPIAAFCRDRASRSPTVPNAACDVASSAWSASVSAPGAGIDAEVLRGHRDRAVDQVAPAGDQLVVVAAHELRPGEVGVLVLRAGRRRGSSAARRRRSATACRRRRSRRCARRRTCGPPSCRNSLDTTSYGRFERAERARRRRPWRRCRSSRTASPARSRRGRRCCPCP